MLKYGFIGAGIGAGMCLFTGIGLNLVGFTAGGVSGGSFAAVSQAGIGNVVAGSPLALSQSLGATGGFFGATLISIFTAIGGAIGALFKIIRKCFF